MRGMLIAAGVRNLLEWGYPQCNKKNILTDEIYSEFFLNMLEDNKGAAKEADEAIEALIAEIKGVDELEEML